MKTTTICLSALLLSALLSGPVFADTFFIEGGPGFFKSLHSDAFFFRYQRDTSRLFSLPSYWEGVFGHWNNGNRANVLGLSRGILFHWSEKRSVDAAFGLLGLDNETHNLGTHFQFYIRLGYNFKLDGYQLAVSFVHISNGKLIFGWNGPNSGENFITLGIGLF